MLWVVLPGVSTTDVVDTVAAADVGVAIEVVVDVDIDVVVSPAATPAPTATPGGSQRQTNSK
jgi:hypothetical protein